MAKGGEGGYVMCPQTPQETQRWVPKWKSGKRRKLGHAP
jgi:hypothetical protein